MTNKLDKYIIHMLIFDLQLKQQQVLVIIHNIQVYKFI